MLTSFISSLHGSNIQTVQETITSFKLIYTQEVQDRQPVDIACAALSNLSPRDEFEIIFEAGESLLRTTCIDIDLAKLDTFAIDAIDIGEISVTLTIAKKIHNNAVSIYSSLAFERYLMTEDIVAILATLNLCLNGTLHFDFNSAIGSFQTQTISYGASQACVVSPVVARDTIITNFKEAVSFSGIPGLQLIPNDFHIRAPTNNSAPQELFSLLCGLLSLTYLANASELNSSHNFSFRIYGYKAVDANNVDRQYLISNCQMLYKIYRWVYDTDNITDKLGLARNVISLHLDASGVPVLDQSVWDAIQSNYKIYLKGNIESYLEVKGKIAELLIDAIGRTNHLLENLLDSLKNNALVLVTFLITVVVINGVKDLSVASIFTLPYLIVTLVLTGLSGAWLFLMRKDVNDRFKIFSDALANVLRRNYIGVLTNDEIDRSINPAITENKKQLDQQVKKYTTWWVVMLGSFVVFYLLGFFLHSISSTQKIETSTIQKDILQNQEIPLKSKNDKQIPADIDFQYTGPRP